MRSAESCGPSVRCTTQIYSLCCVSATVVYVPCVRLLPLYIPTRSVWSTSPLVVALPCVRLWLPYDSQLWSVSKPSNVRTSVCLRPLSSLPFIAFDRRGVAPSFVAATDPPQPPFWRLRRPVLDLPHDQCLLAQASNLLLDSRGNLKLGDFGLAIQPNPMHLVPLTNRVITLWYRPPEVLMGSTDYDSSVDIWSCGCIFAELLVRLSEKKKQNKEGHCLLFPRD